MSIHHSDLEATVIQSGNSSVICSPGVKNGCFIGRSSSFGIENLVLLRIPSVTHLGRGRPWILSQRVCKMIHIGWNLVYLRKEVCILLLLLLRVNMYALSFFIEPLVILAPQLMQVLLAHHQHCLLYQRLFDGVQSPSLHRKVVVSCPGYLVVFDVSYKHLSVILTHQGTSPLWWRLWVLVEVGLGVRMLQYFLTSL